MPKTIKAQDVHGIVRETHLAFYDVSSLLKPAEASQPAPSSSQQYRIQPLLFRAAAVSPALRCAAVDDSGPDWKQTHSHHSFQQKEEIGGT